MRQFIPRDPAGTAPAAGDAGDEGDGIGGTE
jgi:hypothetical protein